MVFITVDPERDTQDQLKTYLGYFNKAIIGLTGTEEEVTEAANRFDTRFRKQTADADGYYSVDHTSFIYIRDQEGEARYVIPYNIGPEMILEGVLSLTELRRVTSTAMGRCLSIRIARGTPALSGCREPVSTSIAAQDEDPVAAKVGRHTIYLSNVFASIESFSSRRAA